MTLNNVVQRIQQLSLGHNQVRKFYEGLVTDFLTDQKTKYPAVFLQSSGGNISIAGHATTLNYKMFFVDLVHLSEDTNLNVRDVQSDMVSIAMDVLAQINNSNYTDWSPGSENNLQILVEEDNDLFAGCSIDISIRINYTQNICAVPTDITNYIPTDNTDMKLVYDLKYIATGAEGLTISIPEIVGKKVLLITRENNQIYKVSSAPDSAEFTWNDTIITLGAITNPGERFLILYRNY